LKGGTFYLDWRGEIVMHFRVRVKRGPIADEWKAVGKVEGRNACTGIAI